MKSLEILSTKADLQAAGRQEALRWQAYVRRAPLFLLLALALSGVLLGSGFGLFRGMQTLSAPLQAFIYLGYAVVYWTAFTLSRLIQGWFKARQAARARFRSTNQRTLLLSHENGVLSLAEGRWRIEVPNNRIYSTYMTRDYVFLESPFLTWIPLPRTRELLEFLTEARKPVPKPEPLEEDAKKEAAETTAPSKSETEEGAG